MLVGNSERINMQIHISKITYVRQSVDSFEKLTVA